MLIDILNRISRAEGGLELSDDAVKSRWVDLINTAARELYESLNLRGSSRTETFDSSFITQEIIALPSKVFVPYCIRRTDNQEIFTFKDQSSRFRESPSNQYAYVFHRFSPLKREILNAGPLVFTIPDVEAAAVNITITGRTDKASFRIETVTIPAGQTSVNSANNWFRVDSLVQDRHDYDVTVSDIDGIELAVLPNNQSEVTYCLYRQDEPRGQSNPWKACEFELHYKPVYEPMLEDSSQFQCGSIYDDVIMWLTLSRSVMLSKRAADDIERLVSLYNRRVDTQLTNIHRTTSVGTNEPVQVPNPFVVAASHEYPQTRLYRRY